MSTPAANAPTGRLTDQQAQVLLKGIPNGRVQILRGMAHLEAWDVRRTLIRIFGFEGFSIETLALDLVHERGVERRKRNRDGREYGDPYTAWTVVYRAQIRLTIRDFSGRVITWFEDAAAGDAVNQPSLGDAHDLAMKGLALETKIPTPAGWTTMGEIQVGDTVFDMAGKPVKVLATSEVKNLPCYRITFTDGTSVICDEEHLWVARVAQEKQKVHAVRDLYDARQLGKRIIIPPAGALELPPAALPVDPWLMGFWLGDGNSSKGTLTVHRDDLKEVEAGVRRAGYAIIASRTDGPNTYTVSIKGLAADLKRAGVFRNKHIPPAYLRASLSQRRALLSGLMDSDGTVDTKSRRASFTNTRKNLADGVAELVRSMDENAYFGSVERSGFGVTTTAYVVQWRPDFVPFTLARKAAKSLSRIKRRFGARVKDIELVPSVPTRCIAVDSPTHTFLFGDRFVPTHNTSVSQALKRCAVNLGDQFGLSLYNDGSRDPVVIRSLAYMGEPVENDPPVRPEPQPVDRDVDGPSEAEAPQRDYLTEAWAAATADAAVAVFREAENAGASSAYLDRLRNIGQEKRAAERAVSEAPEADGRDPLQRMYAAGFDAGLSRPEADEAFRARHGCEPAKATAEQLRAQTEVLCEAVAA